MADFYPSREDELIAWHAAFSAAVASYAAALGLAAPVVTQVATDATTVSNVLTYLAQAQQFSSEVVAFKNQVLHGDLNTPNPVPPTVPASIVMPLGWLANIEARTRQLVTQIRANGAFTQQMAEDMGIVSTPTEPGQVEILSAIPTSGGRVDLTVLKAGYGVVALDSRRAGGDWEQIALLTTASYEDARPLVVGGQPEERDYRCQAYENNGRTGSVSATVTVTASP